MTAPRIAFLETHLMGSGHLARVLNLAGAVRAAGGEAMVVSGGRPLAHLPLGPGDVQLPPVHVPGLNYRDLRGPDGAPAGDALWAARQEAVAGVWARFRPDVLVTELFPFGRRQMAAEFEALAAARPLGTALVSSVRDVPEPPKKEKRARESLARLAGYEAVLVHGDRSVLALEEVWPGHGLSVDPGLLRYTGYVAPAPAAATDGEGAGEVLVSVGSGGIGRRLLELAARAAAGHGLRWRLMAPGAEAERDALRALGPAVVEAPRGDFRALLPRCAVSISLAGYNTAVEAATRGGPSILVPMEEGDEQEQLIRAAAFARLPGVSTRRIGMLTPETLRDAVDASLDAAPAEPPKIDLDGARRSAEILMSLA
ncbi:glycosyltransferase family protein [Rhodovulum sp. DZ06]|uniref:glycosyltransferase family protein n=1 Tax=Rhodovulum sp. DZ06 TaxID=3425126 RepID=UPI003D33343E